MDTSLAALIGYAASFFLIVSLIVNGDIKFRIYNSFGCIFFIIYGLLINQWPVVITNSILLIINIIYLTKQFNYKESFEIVAISGNEMLIKKFLDFYAVDIAVFFPDFNKEEFQNNYNFIVLRDLVIANIFSINIGSNGDAIVALNYTTKKYRDYKVSKFIFEKENMNLKAKGAVKIMYHKTKALKYKKLLSLNGFGEEGDYFTKNL